VAVNRRVRVGVRLKTLRAEHFKWGQAKLAQELGCSQSFIAEMEANRSGPSAKVMVGLYRLGVSSDWLLTGKPPMLRSTPSTPSTPSTSDPSDRSAPSESLSVRDGPCSSLSRPTLTIELPPEAAAGDTILIRIERREHPLALIGKILYTIRRK